MNFKTNPLFTGALSLIAAGTLGVPESSSASERRFAYSYEANTYVPGSLELENWITWRESRGGDDRFDFRHELEWGVTERLQLGFYFVDWRYQEHGEAEYHDTAIEAIYNLSNPNTDWMGSSLYGEVKFAHEFLELESKIILQKNFGPWSLAYNFTVEAEWEEDGLQKTKGELAHSLGLSYTLSPKATIGAELFTEVEIDDWSDYGDHALYLGPNTSLRFGSQWLTAAALWQVTDTHEPDFQLRAIWGIHF